MPITTSLSPNGNFFSEAAKSPERVLVGTVDGFCILEKPSGNAPWAMTRTCLAGLHISAIVHDAQAGAIVVGAYADGIWMSDDDGKTWGRRDEGITQSKVYSLTADRRGECLTILAGTEPVSIYKSSDLGATWIEFPSIGEVPGHERWTFPAPPHLAHVKSITVDPHDPETIYAAVEQGALLRSTDGGNHWIELAGYSEPSDEVYRDIHRVVPVPQRRGEIYMTSGVGAYRSKDRGDSWERLTDRSFAIGYPDHLIVSPEVPDVVFMSGASKSPKAWMESHMANCSIYRTDDAGATWEKASEGFSEAGRANIEAMSVVAYPGGFSMFAADSDGDVYCSEDRGQSWNAIATGLPPVAKGIHADILRPVA